jgi:hypothetical protein
MWEWCHREIKHGTLLAICKELENTRPQGRQDPAEMVSTLGAKGAPGSGQLEIRREKEKEKEPTLAKPARMGHPGAFLAIKARPPARGGIVRLW